jgi:hypothetical protein
MRQPSPAALDAFIRQLHADSKALPTMLESRTMRESYASALAAACAVDYPTDPPSSALPGTDLQALQNVSRATMRMANMQPVLSYAHQLATLATALRNADVIAAGGDDHIGPVKHYLDFASDVLDGAYMRAGQQFPTLIDRITLA